MDCKKIIPFGAFDSELMHQEISIPEGFEASIDGNKIILTKIESKDEKIRKELIEHIKANRIADYVLFKKFSSDDVIAWLEKQSKQTLSQTNERAWLYLVSDVLTWKDGIGQYLDDSRVQELAKKLCSEYAQKLYNPSVLSNSSNTGNNNQKLTNEVKPKFKVGDWIVFNGLVLHIDEIVDGYYRTTTIGGIPNSYDWDIDNVARLWSIEDAKPGDVLISKYGSMCIFKDKKSCYCYIDTEHENFYATNNRWFSIDYTLKPATQEQREILFTKMEEADYEWDAKKKELNEIKHRI